MEKFSVVPVIIEKIYPMHIVIHRLECVGLVTMALMYPI